MARKKRRVKKTGLFFLIILFGVIVFIIYDVFFSDSNISESITNKFDEVIDNITKSTEAYKKCMNSKSFNEDNFSDNLKNKKAEIIDLYNGINADFMYTDLESGYSFGEGTDNKNYAASVSKLPAVFYAYKLADDGKLNLDDEVTYLAKYKAGGSGVIQKEKVGTVYKMSTLLEYAIKYSDNIAYYMILDEIGGTSKVKEYWESLGYKIEFTDRFGNLPPSLGNGYIKEVYNYYLTGNENAKKLINDMKVSDNLQYVKTDDVEVAHKYGEYVEGSGYYNDVSLNFTDHPFALSITSTLGLTNQMKTLFLKTHNLSILFNNLYWEEKGNYCMEKSQTLM